MIATPQRRWIARAIKLGLVGAAVLVVMAWIGTKRSHPRDHTEVRIDRHPARASASADVQVHSSAIEALGPGDMRIYNQDSSVHLVLRGHEVLAGLSPQMRDRITQEITQSTTGETAGFGAAVANVVRTTVASAIAAHAVYAVHDIREIEYRDGQIVIVRNSGRRVELLGDVKTDGKEISRTFPREDALRFVQAVRARKRALAGR